MAKRLSNKFKSMYKARNNFLASQPLYKSDKFGTIKYGKQTLKYGLSKEEEMWLDRLAVPYRSIPISTFTIPGTNKKKVYIVDGYDQRTNTVYEFLGDLFHGSYKTTPTNRDKVIPWLKKSANQLYAETIERFRTLYSLNYKIFFIWESDYKSKKTFGRYYKGYNDNLY